jgi:hypothetical protein
MGSMADEQDRDEVIQNLASQIYRHSPPSAGNRTYQLPHHGLLFNGKSVGP